MHQDNFHLAEGGIGPQGYADAVETYLAFAVSKALDRNTTLCTWEHRMDRMGHTFTRHALPMTWDFVETNPLGGAGGDIYGTVFSLCEVLDKLIPGATGEVAQIDAQCPIKISVCGSTDPPYYDNIGYADLSDFFYVWLRRSLSNIWPELFSTLLVPKAQELVATPYRFGGNKAKAQLFFEEGLGKAFSSLRRAQVVGYPMTVFYAFKQAESEEDDGEGTSQAASTGWETMLEGLIRSGFAITATWPMRTELANRTIAGGTNALASSVVLACRPRPSDAPMATRKELLTALRKELPPALYTLQQANIAPVDLAQAAIGPGMAVFSRYAKVLDADGSSMKVRTALQLINQELGTYLAEQEGEMDSDSRFCLAWFEEHGMKDGPFGAADVLARAKDTSVDGITKAGCLVSKAGKVRILSRQELHDSYDPVTDPRRTVWECAQHLIKALEKGGVEAAGRLASRMGADYSDQAKGLAYRLFAICEKKKWADEALAYNSLITSWTDIQDAAKRPGKGVYQPTLQE